MVEKISEKDVPPQQKGAWLGFIKSIATFKGDLASLTAPPFLLSSQSMIEFSSYWCEHPSTFVAPASETCPEKRALLVLKWFLSTLKQQHNNKEEDGRKKKMKPLNPFLGEIFEGSWRDDNGITRVVAEQVSHHPPISAFNLWNEKHGVSLRGSVAPKIYFSSTVHIERKGHSILHIDRFDEDHLVTMPKVHVEGLMSGHLSPELSGFSYLRSSSGFTTKIEFFYKGWLGGKRNSFIATLYRDGKQGKKSEALYEVEGVWNETFTVKDLRTKKVVETINVADFERSPFIVKPLEEQDPMESRRAWQHVAAAIENGDMITTGKEKSKIENQQRERRRQEKEEGIEFERRYFSRGHEDSVATSLIEGVEREMGVKRGTIGDDNCELWTWDEEKFKHVAATRRGKQQKMARERSVDSGIVIQDE